MIHRCGAAEPHASEAIVDIGLSSVGDVIALPALGSVQVGNVSATGLCKAGGDLWSGIAVQMLKLRAGKPERVEVIRNAVLSKYLSRERRDVNDCCGSGRPPVSPIVIGVGCGARRIDPVVIWIGISVPAGHSVHRPIGAES